MGQINTYNIVVRHLKGRDFLEDLGVWGRIIVKWISNK
jgi:hypothetical protein